MHQKILILITISSLLFHFNIKAQNQDSKLLMVITQSGDSLVASKILKKKTNEDRVVFMWNGKRKELKAKEVKTYYSPRQIVSINISSDNQNKLVEIILNGDVKLARSISSKRVKKFYLQTNQEWISLNPYSNNLKQELSKLLPDFNRVIKKKKVHYDLVSLSKVISKYNEYKDSSYKRIGAFQYTDRIKSGVFGSIGSRMINIEDYPEKLGSSINTTFGIGTHFQYNRLFSFWFQLGFSQNSWENEDWDIKLRTLDFTPLLSTQLYHKLNRFKLSAAIGLNMNLDISSQITGPEFNGEIVGLDGFSFGYDFQLHGSFGQRFNAFVSYQIMPKQRTENYEFVVFERFVKFDTNQFRLGLFYFL